MKHWNLCIVPKHKTPHPRQPQSNICFRFSKVGTAVQTEAWVITTALRTSDALKVCIVSYKGPNVFNTFFTFMCPCIIKNFFIIRPTRCTNFANLFLAWNSTCFGQCLCPSSGVHSLYTQQWYMSHRFVDSCVTYTIAECTVNGLLMMDKDTVRNM